jgi:hypothetical protein
MIHSSTQKAMHIEAGTESGESPNVGCAFSLSSALAIVRWTATSREEPSSLHA